MKIKELIEAYEKEEMPPSSEVSLQPTESFVRAAESLRMYVADLRERLYRSERQTEWITVELLYFTTWVAERTFLVYVKL
jgi:hypothetical protein